MNLMTSLESMLKQLASDDVNMLFGWLLVGIFGFAIFCFLISRRKRGFFFNFYDYAPVLLTSLGILGTFSGIVIGLLNFDISNIDSSISELLGGMKTAFLTSIVGVAFSILLKVIYSFKIEKENESKDLDNIIEHFYKQTDLSEQQLTEIKSLISVLGDSSDSSFISQFKLLRSDISDQAKHYQQTIEKQQEQFEKITTLLTSVDKNLQVLPNISADISAQQQAFTEFKQQLWEKLQAFADMLSKSATEQVIEALKLVIIEFNQKLTEQFGENFKELNRAVLLLVEWQENYKQQLTEMIALYNTGVNAISSTEQAVGNIENSAKNIPITMDKLQEVIEVNQHQIAQLENHLAAFAQLKEKAVEAIPETQKQIQLMLDNLTSANSELISGLQSSNILLNSAIATSAEQLSKHIAENTQKLGEAITESATEFKQNSRETNQALINNAQKLQEVGKQSQEELTQSIKFVTDKYQDIHQQMLNASRTLTENTEKWQMDFSRVLNETQKKVSEEFENLMRNQISENKVMMTKLAEEGKNALDSTGQSVRNQLDLIDQSAQAEIQRVMTEMGQALATISQQFTQDYERLVKEMQRITQYRG